MQSERTSWLHHAGALLIAGLGCGGVLALVLMMNVRQENKTKQVKSTKLELVYQPPRRRPPVRRKVRRRQRRVQRQMRAPQAPLPQVGAALSGVNFGIPSLASTGLDQASDQLLGQTKSLNKLVMTEKSVDTPPRAVSRVVPRYPARARSQNITGYVTMRLLIGTQGEVVEAEVTNAQPPGTFDQVALTAIQQWRFTPAMYKGTPVRVRATQTLRFKLQ